MLPDTGAVNMLDNDGQALFTTAHLGKVFGDWKPKDQQVYFVLAAKIV
jgi:hypothetical protein